MRRFHVHPEGHLVQRIGWLRAAVLGANDGIVSTASLIVGVAAASAALSDVLLAAVAGLVAGAMSMAPATRPATAASRTSLRAADAAATPTMDSVGADAIVGAEHRRAKPADR